MDVEAVLDQVAKRPAADVAVTLSWIGDQLIDTRREPSVALETRIQRAVTTIVGVVVAAEGVALPDLHPGCAHRLARLIQDAAMQVADLAARDAWSPGDADQIIVVVKRQLAWVERPQCLRRRAQQSRPGRESQREPGGGTGEQNAAIG